VPYIRSHLDDHDIDYVEVQDLAGLERERVVQLGVGFLADAKGETV